MSIRSIRIQVEDKIDEIVDMVDGHSHILDETTHDITDMVD